MIRSLQDAFLITLGLVPSNDIFAKFRNKIRHVPLSTLSSVLSNHAIKPTLDKTLLLKKINLKHQLYKELTKELPKSESLWDRLKLMGSGLEPKHFKDIPIEGNYSTELIEGNFSSQFIDRLEKLLPNDQALRKLEWNFLKIGRIYNRDELLNTLKPREIEIINQSTDLTEVLSRLKSNKLLIYSVGKALVYRSKHDPDISPVIYKECKKWVKLDPIHCSVILDQSLQEGANLKDLMNSRIVSNKRLTKQLQIMI